VAEIRLRGTSPANQLSEQRLNRRLDWDIEDDRYDNERADRNAESLIRTRDDRVNIYRDNSRASNARADRNTQSLITTRNQRAAAAGSGGKGKGGGGANASLPLVRTPAEAMKLPKGTRFRTPDGQVKVRP